jgi:hypothetical protein
MAPILTQRFLCTLTILISNFALLSCTNTNSSSPSSSISSESPLIVTVTFDDPLRSFQQSERENSVMSLRIDQGIRQPINIRNNSAKLSILGLSEKQYSLDISFEYNLNNTTIELANYITEFNYSATTNELRVSTSAFDLDHFDYDNDGYSNWDEIMAGANPLGSIILYASPTNISVTEGNTEIITLAAYTPTPQESLMYTKVEGQDSAMFLLDEKTGKLSFISAPQLSASSVENEYHLSVSISDSVGNENVSVDLVVTVTDSFGIKVSQEFKSIVFDWQDITSASSYALLNNSSVNNDYEILASGITTSNYSLPMTAHQFNTESIFQVSAFDTADNLFLTSHTYTISDNLRDTIGILKPPSYISSKSFFGHKFSLSTDGKVLAVSIYENPYNSSPVYIYSNEENNWILKAQLSTEKYYFGSLLSLNHDGKVLVISGLLLDCTADYDKQTACGAIFIYQNDNSTWNLSSIIKPEFSYVNIGLDSPLSISRDGNTLAIGSPWDDSQATLVNGMPLDRKSAAYLECINIDPTPSNCQEEDSGAAYIFRRNPTGWTQQAYIKASNTHAGTHFGSSVDISSDGNILVVGSANEQSKSTAVNGYQTNECHLPITSTIRNCIRSAGAAYVYRYDNENWTFEAYIKPINTTEYMYFGQQVSMSGNGMTIAVGTGQEGSAATGINGNPEYTCASPLPDPLNSNCTISSGAVYIYQYGTQGWQHDTYIKPPVTDIYTRFGDSFALNHDGTHLVVGADGARYGRAGVTHDLSNYCGNYFDSNSCQYFSGTAYYYQKQNDLWQQPALIKASYPHKFDAFGTKVAFSDDGSTIAVSAPNENSAATGFNDPTTGIQFTNSRPLSGAIYIY